MRRMSNMSVSTTAPERRKIFAYRRVLAPFVHCRINAIVLGGSHEEIGDDFGCGGSCPAYDQHGGAGPDAGRSGHSRARAKCHADRQAGRMPGLGPVLRARLYQNLRPVPLLVPAVLLSG